MWALVSTPWLSMCGNRVDEQEHQIDLLLLWGRSETSQAGNQRAVPHKTDVYAVSKLIEMKKTT
jgi:hypothetical protein